jgi:hypothetical protein
MISLPINILPNYAIDARTLGRKNPKKIFIPFKKI